MINMTDNEKLKEILRHIKRVEDNCNLLASKLKDKVFARQLIARGRIHDVSKLGEFEFKHLNKESRMLDVAKKMHHQKNSHHPEYYEYKQEEGKRFFMSDPSTTGQVCTDVKGIDMMEDLDIAEMVCDCFARSQEKGNSIKEFLFEIAPKKYGYEKDDKTWKLMETYLDLLLTPEFKNKRTRSKIVKKEWPEEPWQRAMRSNGGFDGHDSVYNSYTDKK